MLWITCISQDAHQDLKIAPHPSHSRSARPESTSFCVENSTKRDVHLSTRPVTEDLTPKHAPVIKSVNATDQKTLRVRIKVGSDNASARKNAEIYSGLGLDYSPSSSFEDSPVGSGVLSPGYRDAPNESPMSVLKVLLSTSIFSYLFLNFLCRDIKLHLILVFCSRDGCPF